LKAEEVAKVIVLIGDGRSLPFAAAAVMDVPYSTVTDALQRFRETQNYSRKPGYDQKRKTKARDDQFIMLQILGNRLTILVEVQVDSRM
ncbi:hypothetical protein ANN_08451, partial [Periplaneta americana]